MYYIYIYVLYIYIYVLYIYICIIYICIIYIYMYNIYTHRERIISINILERTLFAAPIARTVLTVQMLTSSCSQSSLAD